MKQTVLLLLVFFAQLAAQAQTHVVLEVGDTLTYSLKHTGAKWLYVFSEQANVAISLSFANQKNKTIDESKGVASFEKIRIDTLDTSTTHVKIWVQSYLSKAQEAQVSIYETSDYLPSKIQFTKEQYLQDLAFFETLRRKANSGLLVYRTSEQVDSVYQWARERVNTCESIFDFYKIIAHLTDFEGSCHNYTHLPQAYGHYFPEVAMYLPFSMYYLNGQLIQDATTSPIPLGAQIISINGIQEQEVVARMGKYYTTDGFSYPYKPKAAFMKGLGDTFLIEFGGSKQYAVTYKYQSKQYKVTLPALTKADFTTLLQSRKGIIKPYTLPANRYEVDKVSNDLYRLSIRGFDFAMQKGDENYVAFHTFLQNTFDQLKREEIQNLIIDLRGNKGGAGMLYELVYSYLTKRPFRDSHFAYSSFNEVPFGEQFMVTSYLLANQVHNADTLTRYLKEFYPFTSQGKYYLKDERNPLILPQETTFEGQLYLLIDEDVASAGAHLASLIKSYTNAIVIGNETSGGYYEHNGHLPVEYRLPHTGILTGFSILYVCQDAQILKDQLKGSGVMPHIQVNPSKEEFLNQKDTALETVKGYVLKRLLENKHPFN